MKVLWITNILLPDASRALGLPAPVTGGWMHSSARKLAGREDVELAVASPWQGKELKKIMAGGISYYLIPVKGDMARYHVSLEKEWLSVKRDFMPDVVHIHGTEFAHGLSYLKACGSKGVVVSLQGLVSAHGRYFYGGLSCWDVLKNITVRDLIRRDTLFHRYRRIIRRGKIELQYLQTVNHIIGRTSWDKAHARAANPGAAYHFGSETMRGAFYRNTWSYAGCEKHSIFLSQAASPLKGLHQVLKAMPLVLREYPDTKLYIAGADIIAAGTLKERMKRTGYGKYISSLIRKYKLEGRVVFTGPLDEGRMCGRYLDANVFICPSSIENSPNSLGEAQLLGVPYIASYAGGIPDIAENDKSGMLYRFEETEMLAAAICGTFAKKEFAIAPPQTLERYNPDTNAATLLNIYKQCKN